MNIFDMLMRFDASQSQPTSRKIYGILAMALTGGISGTSDGLNPSLTATVPDSDLRFTNSIELWGGLSNAPLKYIVGGGTIPTTQGTINLPFSLVNTVFNLRMTNGSGPINGQTGVYTFLDANDLEVLRLETFSSAAGSCGWRYSVDGNDVVNVPPISYGNGAVDLKFRTTTVDAFGYGPNLNALNTQRPGNATITNVRLSDIRKLRVSVRASSSSFTGTELRHAGYLSDEGDIYWDYTSFLMQSAVPNATDVSKQAHTVTRTNTELVHDLSFDGGSAMYLYNGASRMTIPSPVGGMLDLSSGDFTVESEVQFFQIDSQNNSVYDCRSSYSRAGLYLSPSSDTGMPKRKLQILAAQPGIGVPWGVNAISEQDVFTNNKSYKIAMCRKGDKFYGFVDGIKVIDATYSGQIALFGTTTTLGAIFNNSSNTATLKGRLGKVRITKGVARYTENYTTLDTAYPEKPAPYTALLLKLNSPEGSRTVVDTSLVPKQCQVYGGAAAQFVSVPSRNGSTAFNSAGVGWIEIPSLGLTLSPKNIPSSLGCVDLTLDAWFYYEPGKSFQFYSLGAPGAGGGTIANNRQGASLRLEPTGVIRIGAGNASTDGLGGYYEAITNTLSLSTGWHFIRFIVSNNLARVFVDGIERSLSNTPGTSSSLSTCKLWHQNKVNIQAFNKLNGSDDTTSWGGTSTPFDGIIDELRLILHEALPGDEVPQSLD